MNKKIVTVFYKLGIIVISAFLTSFAFHMFILSKGFVPGGINGVAAILSYLTGANTGYFLFVLNLPILLLVFLKINRKTACAVLMYIACQSIFLLMFEQLDIPTFEGSNVLVYAIGGGVISGLGFALMLKNFGISGGTYAIGSLMLKRNPTLNIVWLSFAMDSLVVFASFFVFAFNIESVICTFVNLFIANKVFDFILQGFRLGYKYEMITDFPSELSKEIMDTLNTTVTMVPARGMYSSTEKSMLICVVRKKQLGEFSRLLKSHPEVVVFISKISDQIGGRTQASRHN